MDISALPKDADALVAFAESIATALAEKREQLGIEIEVESPLRTAEFTGRNFTHSLSQKRI